MKKFIVTLSTVMLLSLGFSGQAFAASYKVQSGDTLWSIAKKNKVTVAQLKSWNKLSSDNIKPNQVLQLSGKSAPAAASAKNSAPTQNYKELTVTATAYTASCKGCSGITATGINLKKNPNAKVISVDPRVIPLGSKVYVEGYGYAIAADKGHAIKNNKIDVFFSSHSTAKKWGVKKVKIKVYQ
ncbi:LysM peptidoglycan-binding domain-containing protein [Bacillus lacus]|uniref:LysM peptidoglycan-binding domain-containing protein n=1 Tax=Metabacillus lacus TaxID=1983721 RepID=A0A7X2IZ30_9BACI|nr:3D domain-containing protein [Metabacillus lacus]MRX72451.1 LysM peptidoglycan-binding domain-containing protein [Metabacillus lacus]